MHSSAAARSLGALTLLKPLDCADTAAATGTGVDVSAFEGFITVIQQAGILDAGTLDGAIVTSDSSDLSGAVSAGTFTQVTTGNDNPNVQLLHLECSALKQYIGYVGTIATGGALVAVTAVGSLKYIG